MSNVEVAEGFQKTVRKIGRDELRNKAGYIDIR